MPGTHNSPLVSIILATYNGEQYLKEQLDSIIAQTYKNIEIIAIDDRSTDNTIKILKEYSVLHKNIKIFINEHNLGFIKNFDKGCSLCAGDFIALCDQDDYWSNDKIEKLVNNIEDYPMIHSDSYLCNSELEKSGKQLSDIVNYLTLTNCLQQSVFCRLYGNTLFFTRNLYKQTHPFIDVIPHDWWLAFNATLQGGIKYLPEPLVFYRQHESNLYGAVGGKKKKHNKLKSSGINSPEQTKIRTRIHTFYNTCPDEMAKEKEVLKELIACYKNFSLRNNFKRVALFLKYRNTFLVVKKQSSLKRFFFCFKMFIKIT